MRQHSASSYNRLGGGEWAGSSVARSGEQHERFYMCMLPQCDIEYKLYNKFMYFI